MWYLYVVYVCGICVCMCVCVYVLYVCGICMWYMYVVYVCMYVCMCVCNCMYTLKVKLFRTRIHACAAPRALSDVLNPGP